VGLFSGITKAVGGLLGGGGGSESNSTSTVQSNITTNVTNTIDTTGLGKGFEAFGKGLEAQAEAEHAQDAQNIEAQKQIAVAEITATSILIDTVTKRAGIIIIIGVVIFATRNKWSKLL